MNATDALSKLMKEKKITNAQMASKLECSNSAIYERLTQDNISIRNFVRMLAILDYEVIIQPKAAGRRPDGCYLIDNSRKEQKGAGKR